jgi:mRNA-degrading endonuclease toxin of MazEF toxin-antitoxin module
LASFSAGEIVLADWRDALPKEPIKLRPAIVVEDPGLFGSNYPDVILVPLSEDADMAIFGLSLAIEPTTENGCIKRCYALSHCLAATSVARLRPTRSRIMPAQLSEIRRQIAVAVGATEA